MPEKYVSVTIQKTCDGVFIKREEGIQRLLTVLFEKQTENWYDKKKRAESYIVSNRKEKYQAKQETECRMEMDE